MTSGYLLDLNKDMAILHDNITVNSLFFAERIMSAWLNTAGIKQLSMPQDRYNFTCMLSAIFEAGRIQGKREERKRKRK